MSSVVDFTCMRIQDELKEYIKHNRLPYGLVEGVYTIEDIANCIHTFSPPLQKVAKRLISQYKHCTRVNHQELLYHLKLEYIHIINSLHTRHSDFKFPTVLQQYRHDINPVKALYYEVRNAMLYYNPDNGVHIWLLTLIQDHEFYNKLIEAITSDITKLDYFIAKYYPCIDPLGAPIELIHARQLVKEFAEYKKLFTSVHTWDAE